LKMIKNGIQNYFLCHQKIVLLSILIKSWTFVNVCCRTSTKIWMATPESFGITIERKSLIRDLKSIACERWRSPDSFPFSPTLRFDFTIPNRPPNFHLHFRFWKTGVELVLN
jgi:hypothetical protein